MSFCRITGKARGLPKPNYFPLLPPISPADAKRCCRITTKSQGLPGHHFLPALLGAKGPRAHCRVTAKSEGQGPHHFPDIEGAMKPHDLLPGYKYVFPSFDEDQKQQKHLLNLLSTKIPPGESNAKYVYAVDEKLTGLVIPAELEAAVRDGDVRDVMLDKEGDTMLVKMHRGPNVTIDVTNLVVEEGDVLWDGQGPSESVLQVRRKEEKEAEMRKRRRQEGLHSKKKIFEEKEQAAEKEEIEIAKMNEAKKSKIVKVKMRGGADSLEEVVHVNGAVTPEEAMADESQKPVFGHIVQTATGVEFFPGNSVVGLPQGKIVPGRLIRNPEGAVKFVPGIISEGRFVPGQVVMTNTGEQFVPGQVVETREGPKFVPGQVAETSSGPKFVPGQTIETEDGPQFVPGQIIETKAGPTFIPGQIIVTDDTARFVPGRVVDTAEGPRFVPGRVVESGNQVTFVSGQIVETSEGLKFVAPDLEDMPEGGHEFSVQGFEVTPEELKLLRPAMICSPTSCGDMAIDSRMLRQLSEAGMSVGRQVPAELPDVDIRPLPVVLEKLKLEGVNAIKMGQVMTSLAQVVLKVSERNDICASHVNVDENTGAGLLHAVQKNKDLGKYLRAIVASAVLAVREEEIPSEETSLAAISSATECAFGELAEDIPMDGVVESLHHYLTKPQNLSQIAVETVQHLEANETAIDRLRFAVSTTTEPALAIEKLAAVLKDNMGEAFTHLSSGDPNLLRSVLDRLCNLESIASEQQATETLQKAIVGAVREQGEERLRHMMENSRELSEGKDFKDLLLQSIGLARALGMTHVAAVLLDVVSDSKSLEVLASDPTTIDVLERLTIMRQFAEMKPELNSALRQLISDPEMARSDPGVRELVRHSTALMVVPEEPLQSSADIPTSLLMPHNTLAMEEFLAKTRRPRTLLILKSGLQAVVPREASRAVLTGQVPYAVLDEKGIKYFEPMHLFSTMKLPQYAAHAFSMYCVPEVEYDSGIMTPADSTPRGSISSTEEYDGKRRNDWSRRSTLANGHCDTYTNGLKGRRATLDQPISKHILDRRLSDWANGTLFINNGSITSNDSLLYEKVNGTHELDSNSSYFNGNEDHPNRKRSDIIMPQVSDLYTVVKDFTADDENAISLRRGESVEVLDIGSTSAKRLKLEIGGDAGELLDTSAARHKLSVRPKRKHADPRQRDTSPLPEQTRWLVRTVEGVSKQGWVPSNILKLDSPTFDDHRPEDAKYKREAVVRELVETEEEFGRDLQNVVDHYIKPLDSSSVPRIVRDNIDVIFSNLRQIANFHNTVLIEGVKYYANEPRMLGKTFLRLERDFDKHVAYCRDEPAAQEFLIENPGAKDFFEELSQRLGDDKSLSEHLKLPIQRINDYQLLLKELVKYSGRLGENTDDLKRALELMLAVPHRANDNKFISNIEGFHGNIHKLGRLLRHDWFTVTDRDNKSKERYLFLFKARILTCKVKRISEDRSVFVLKDIIRLPEVEVRDCADDNTFELLHKEPNYANFPIRICGHKDDVKSAWLKEIKKYASDALALQEHAADDLRISEDSHIKENTDPASLLKAQLEARLHRVAKKIETEVQDTQEIIKNQEQSKSSVKTHIIEVSSQQSSIPPSAQSAPPQVDTSNQITQTSIAQQKTLQSQSQTQLKSETQTTQVSQQSKPPADKVPPSSQSSGKPSEPSKPSTAPIAPVAQSQPQTQSPTPQPTTPKASQPSVSEVPQPQTKPVEAKDQKTTQPSPPTTNALSKPVEVPKPSPVTKQPESKSEPTAQNPSAETKPSDTHPLSAKPIAPPETQKSTQPQEPSKPAPAPAEPEKAPQPQPKPPSTPEPQKTTSTTTESQNPTQAQQPPTTDSSKSTSESSKPPPSEPPNVPQTQEVCKRPQAVVDPQKATQAEEVTKTQVTTEEQKAPPVQEPSKKPEAAKPQAVAEAQKAPPAQEQSKKPEPAKPQAVAEAQKAPPAQEPAKTQAVPEAQKAPPAQEPSKKPEPAKPQAVAEAQKAPPAQEPSKKPEPAKTQAVPEAQKAPQTQEAPKPTQTPAPPKPAEAQKPPQAQEPPKPSQPAVVQAGQLKTKQPTVESQKEVQPTKTVVEQPKASPAQEPTKPSLPAAETQKPAQAQPSPQPQQNPGGVQTKQPEPASPAPSEGGIKRPATDEPSGEKKQKSENMSGISSTTTSSTKIVEESYSISSQREGVFVQSSSSQFSASSVTSSSAVSASSYQSSSITGGATEVANTKLAITDAGKPVFRRTISGLSLEPGDTAVFECQLESAAQVTWLKDNKALEDKLADRVIKSSADDHSYRLELQHVIEYDTGIYTALAQTGDASSTCTAQLVVQGISEEEQKRRAEANAPLFTVRLKDTELLLNTNFRFMVKVRGNPNPEVKFFKDGKPVQGDDGRVVLVNEKADIGFYELVIGDVQAQDAGKYSCVASNKFGEASCEGRVTVTDDKKVFAGLENVKLLEPGEKPEFSWLRDGKPFDPEERFKVLLGNEEDSLALVFQHVRPEDAGLYTCVASTSTGKISCSAELSVQGTVNQLAREPEKPKLTTESKDSEVNIGGSAMLEAKILGFPKPDVKWFHDGQEVKASGRFKFLFEDQESMTLVIKNVTADDAGIYKIVAKNELGEDSTELKLTVKAAPKFKKKLEDLHVMLDEVLKVTAEIDGSPPPDVKWYKDGKELAQSDRVKFVKESNNTYSLVIQKASLADSGSYSVVATNEISQSSEFLKIQVHTPPKFLKNMEKNVEVGEGGKIVFQVKVAADPPPKVRWLKDGVEVKADGSKVKVSVEGDTHTLIVYDCNRDDSANYSIELSNEHGVTVDKGHADVKCAPVFKVGLKDTLANEGDTNVEFSVNINAFPKPSIRWYLDETEITEKRTEYTKVEEGDSYKLIIKEVTTELKGKYTCKVVNDLGSTETSAKLTVNCKPRFGKVLQPKTEVDEGQDLTLQIECYGCPEPEVKWFKDGQEVRADAHIKITRDSHRSESYSMSLNLVKGTDTGDYEVKATNSMGSASTTSHVQVYTKTTEKSEEIVTAMEEEKIEETKHETPTSATVEGTQDKHTVVETSRTTVEFTENDWGGVKVEDLGSFHSEEKNSIFTQGIVEEFSDGENFAETRSQKLSISRGVSIVSLSEDERTISRNNSAADVKSDDSNVKVDLDDNVTVKRESSLKEEEPEIDSESNETPTVTLPLQKRASVTRVKRAESAAGKPEKISDQSPASAVCNGDSGAEVPTTAISDIPQEAEVKPKPLDKTDIKTVSEPSNTMNNKLENEIRGSKVEALDDGESDPAVENLLRRIKEQRSVLEEILNKEMESPAEAFPQISNHDLEQRNVYESLSTSYFVDATGIPRPSATWYKDGEVLKQSERVKISDEGETYRLELLDLVMDDAGVYKCKISNRLGEKTQEAKLDLTSVNAYRKPTFRLPLVDQKIKKLEETVHKCIIVADPVPEIVWLHNGKEIDIDDVAITANVDIKEIENGLFECTYTLTIPKSLHPHTGNYTIKAKNKYGEDESSATLNILLKPEIENLRDITGIPYEEAEFEAIVYSNPAAVVNWLDKSGTKVKNNDHTIITEDRKNEIFKLKFVNIGLGDAGDYTLETKNDQGETTQTVNFHVHTEAPTIVKPLEDVKALDYSDVDYHIRFNGVPKAQVKWFKDGKELKSTDRITIETTDEGQVSSSLSIKHFGVEDVGQYSVTGSNLVGSAESKSNLKMIQLPPTFGKMLPRLEEVDEDDILDLKCKLDGSPVPKVKWFKDGEPLNADEHVQLIAQPDGSVRLLIENVKPTDCGAYKLVAENPNGQTAAICAVAVKPKPCKPTLLKNLEDATEIVGEPLRLEAKIMAFPAPEIKWFKDGHPVRPSQAVNFVNQPGGIIGLIIDSVRPEDAGVYTVKIGNKLGETSGQAKVEVSAREKRPMFEAHLMPVSVVEGFPAKLEVKATGHPKPLIKWTHKGKEVVPDGKHIKIVDQPDGTTCLLLDKATPQDAGEYAAVAVNEKGEVASKAELQVAEKGIAGEPDERPAFLHALRDVSVEEGAPLVLSAPFIGNPIPDVSWTKDDIPITPSERILLTCDGKKVGLEIKPSKLSDAGTYGCRLVSPLGEASSQANASIRKVFQVPTFTQKFTDLQQLPTYVAKFPARVIGVPKPEVEWFHNDKPIKEGDKYHIKRDGDACCLYVRDCAPADSGRYRCRAYNKDGDAECEANLDVVDKIEKQQKIEPPSFLKKTGDCEVYKGMTARFTACASGYPEPDFEWFRGDDKIYPNDRIRMDREGNGLLRLTISGVDAADVGKYRLRIFNPHGEAFCEAELIYESLDSKPKKPIGDQYIDYDKFRVSGAPLPLPDKPIISKMTDRHLTLSWKPSIPHGPRVPVTYRVEMCEQPDGDWFTARTGIRSCACDIRNLEPFRDYKFRIRVENKYGISDPSPFAVTFRQRLEPDPPKFVPYLSPGIDFRPETSPYFPKDFDVEKPPHDGYAQAPRFLRQEHDTQYGVKNHNSNLFWFVYGYPKPKMSYLFNDEPVEMGGRYECSYTRNGQATLFINRMLDRDVGTYEAVATNEHGEARQRVRLEIAEYPTFIQRPEETIIMVRKSGRITARVTGVPYPDIKWYKDWQPLASSSRIKIQQIPPDTVVLILNDVIQKDEGLYSVSARNVAGAVSSSAMVHVEENEQDYGYLTYSKGKNIKPKTKPLSDFYDLGDELGRGTQGVTYHAVERLSGRNYAAKVMHGRADLKAFMLNELDILNVINHRKLIRLQDSFESRDLLILVLELAGGGELLDTLTRQTFTTETEIASYIRQILWGLEYLHSQEIAHLSLTLGDLLLSHPGGDDLKICDFGLSRRIAYGKLAALDYGMPEFVSPEIANGEGVSYPADLWSLGIITYILLSGFSPFKGLNDRDTLTRIREGKWEFNEDRFCNISSEARDFITKLLVYQPEGRLDAKSALKHPWLDIADKIPADQFNITTDNLKSYYSSLKDWYNNASCRTWYRRRPLSGAFSHPSKMVYPPGHVYTPEPEPSPSKESKEPKEPRTWEETVPSREPLDYETGIIQSESHYQYGPDTYLLQLRDVDLPCRLRRYMKVAANRQPGYSLEFQDKHIDWRTPVIRERRRFTDVMDEEIDDERKARINQYGSADIYSLRRLRHELGQRADGHAEAEAMLEYKREGQLPFLREKPQLLAIIDDQPAELSCLAVGEPKPSIQWFKNDLVVTESSRVKFTVDEEGRSYLKFEPALHVDVGIYKVVARNKVGQTIARTRVVVASAPSSPDSPEASEVSDTEILLRWKQPKDDGHSPVLCYSLQYKEADNVEWLNIASNIDHEFWLVKDLKPLTSYVFRLSARNVIGWSEKGIPTALIKTKETGAAKIIVSRAMKHLQTHTEAGGEITSEDSRLRLNYSVEKKPIEWTADSNLTEKYSFVSELSRGQFSVVAKGIERSTDQYVVAKLLEVSNDTEEAVSREFENLRSLRHERVVTLLSALRPAPNIAVLVMEKLQGADILTYFTSRHEYSEQMVATVITQVLDGLQYLHWRGLCHLDIQPDNVVLSSVRALQIKLVDLGSARRVSKLGTIVSAPCTEYTAPEVLCNEPAFPQTDIWSLGTLTYVLLSGVSPFRGVNLDETRQNITFVRYRFEHLYKELTQEATRFLMLVFKRTPNKRPTVEECYEHRWLLPTEFMIKKRERAVFLGNRLKDYCDVYHSEKSEKAIKSEGLTKAFGERILARSNSIQEELTTTF